MSDTVKAHQVFAYCDGRSEYVVAARSKADAARLLKINQRDFARYGHLTGNAADMEVAHSRPGVVFKRPILGPATALVEA